MAIFGRVEAYFEDCRNSKLECLPEEFLLADCDDVVYVGLVANALRKGLFLNGLLILLTVSSFLRIAIGSPNAELLQHFFSERRKSFKLLMELLVLNCLFSSFFNHCTLEGPQLALHKVFICI